MPRIFLIVGARPNFMKMAPLYFVLARTQNVDPVIVHTGQHYDYAMSQAFFEDLELPEAHHFLGAGSGSHAEQTARVMIEFEKVLAADHADLVVVFGDVNSTLACSLTAKKLLIPVAHVEAGLRSFDETMPEEINRRVTDTISDLLFTPSADGDANLIAEGIEEQRIHRVGNIMIDSLVTILGRIDRDQETDILRRLNLDRGGYALVTLHRPSNVDDPESLRQILEYLNDLAGRVPVIFPMHPRTRKNIETFGIDLPLRETLQMIDPVRYREFIVLEKDAKFILTDSGGIQEETTYLGLPCLTLRPNTERPVTISEGTNELVDLATVAEKSQRILDGDWKTGRAPALWDGRTAERIARVIAAFVQNGREPAGQVRYGNTSG